MEEDAQSWLNKKKITETKDPKTGKHESGYELVVHVFPYQMDTS